MQGRLRAKELILSVETECAQTGETIRIEFDEDINIRSVTPGSDPMISVPMVNLLDLNEPCIVDVF